MTFMEPTFKPLEKRLKSAVIEVTRRLAVENTLGPTGPRGEQG